MRAARAFAVALSIVAAEVMLMSPASAGTADAHRAAEGRFAGTYYRGRGDVEYLKLLDIARRMFAPDPEFQNLSMLYTPAWNGLVEGPTWGAWWIQNSYGTTYCGLPFYTQPYTRFLQDSQDLWFDQMGDGKRAGAHDWVAPDGCLCDAAAPGWIMYKQGDGRIDIHDWGMEFTAAGLLMQSELLLISRDEAATAHYLPMLERCANFIETRRDPANDLFLAGPAGNLLAPSYAGWKKPDGSYGMAYLAGLSITYIAALDRLIEVEKLAGRGEKAEYYEHLRAEARKGLPELTTKEGYFVKSIDPDGTRHGVYGDRKYGYFASSPNQDAICFRVVGHAQAERIYEEIASIPGLRPHAFIIPNYPSLDDMYTAPEGLWRFGEWVNGGAWSTCEARMIMAYYRLGKYDDVRRSMHQLMKFARSFRMDNPLTDFGDKVYQPNQPINLCYDTLGPSAAMVRGLFEYLYRADGLTLVPHVPPGITELEQLFPIRFGTRRLYIATAGSGKVTGVWVNGKAWPHFDEDSIFLPYGETPAEARIVIALGGADVSRVKVTFARGAERAEDAEAGGKAVDEQIGEDAWGAPEELEARAGRLERFLAAMDAAGMGASYEAEHARLALRAIAVIPDRERLLAEGKIARLPAASETAADKSYVDTAVKLCDGLGKVIEGDAGSADERRKRVAEMWAKAGKK